MVLPRKQPHGVTMPTAVVGTSSYMFFYAAQANVPALPDCNVRYNLAQPTSCVHDLHQFSSLFWVGECHPISVKRL